MTGVQTCALPISSASEPLDLKQKIWHTYQRSFSPGSIYQPGLKMKSCLDLLAINTKHDRGGDEEQEYGRQRPNTNHSVSFERLPLPPNPMVGFSLPAGMFPDIIVFVLVHRPAIGGTSCRSVNKDNTTTLLETQALR